MNGSRLPQKGLRIALIGATGLIGRSLAPLIAARHDLLVLTRRPTGLDGVREEIADMEQWPGLLAGEKLDVAISTLGTTWRHAGSWPAFAAVDHGAVVTFAAAARACGARQMISVSSVGAEPGARNAYLALKGRVEADLAALGFDRLDLIRPGLLRGPRGADRRPGERFGILVSPLINPFLRGRLNRFAAIDASRVAAGIAALVGQPGEGTFVQHNRELRTGARG